MGCETTTIVEWCFRRPLDRRKNGVLSALVAPPPVTETDAPSRQEGTIRVWGFGRSMCFALRDDQSDGYRKEGARRSNRLLKLGMKLGMATDRRVTPEARRVLTSSSASAPGSV